jgi:galactonate dehydratase
MKSRREFLQKSVLSAGALYLGLPSLLAGEMASDLKITKISHFNVPDYTKATFNQARDVVLIETNDKSISGIGEGGSAEMIQQCAELLIGEDPFRIDHLWQKMYRYYFYPAGREKLHALGALDIALWDIKGKALKVPVYELLGGLSRDYIHCYSTGFPSHGSTKQTAKACIEAGFYAFRGSTSQGEGEVFDSSSMIRKTYALCEQIREGVGEEGNWAVDLHTRFDTHEAITVCGLIEPLMPLFVEDLVRSENPGLYIMLRQKVNVPIAVGEQFGDRWDINSLIEDHLIDFSRVTLPNCGGITEFVKISAICETHYVGLVPHFTGPISTAALTHATGAFPGFVVAEMLSDGPQKMDYLNDDYLVFKNGKLYQNGRHGIGVELNRKKLTLVKEITKGPPAHHPKFVRPDGSITNW